MAWKQFKYEGGIKCPDCGKTLKPFPEMATKVGQAVYRCSDGCNGIFEKTDETPLKRYGAVTC